MKTFLTLLIGTTAVGVTVGYVLLMMELFE